MATFCFGDMHGRHDSLLALLQAAGVVDAEGERLTDDPLLSVGDLTNLTRMDIGNDEEILKLADKLGIIWLLGNHEAPIIGNFEHIRFEGFVSSPFLKTELNKRWRDGLIVPCHVIGNTLISHAGVVKDFDFKTADEAADAIFEVAYRYSHYAMVKFGGTNYIGHFDFGNHGMPKASLLDGIPQERGGNASDGGILWADYHEPKNLNFNQVFGHTPLKGGPVLTHERGTFTLNIDGAVKKGLTPWGVWLDEEGQVIEFVSATDQEPIIDFFSNQGESEEIPAVES